MSLPAAWVDRIFEKLSLVYGRDFTGRWEGMDLNTVKSDWAHELSGFAQHPEAIAWALQNPPERAPSVLDFRKIARLAPEQKAPQLEYSAAGKARVEAELAKLGHVKKTPTMGKDYRAWARAIVERHKAGEKITRAQLAMAKDALKDAA